MGWLELARGLAALLVVISHGSLAGVPSQYFPFIVSLGTSAVAFFFVLSGFIILHIHGRDLGRPDMAANYAWRRVVRIFPTYWLVFTIDLSLHLFVGNRAGIAEMGLGWIVHEALLLPGGQLYVSVAWTLRHELLFYGLFLVAILNRRAGALLFGCWPRHRCRHDRRFNAAQESISKASRSIEGRSAEEDSRCDESERSASGRHFFLISARHAGAVSRGAMACFGPRRSCVPCGK
ncbi:acyltransferase family protein [Bradyrhizobium denitrificans]